MDGHTHTQSLHDAPVKTYVVLPPEPEAAPKPFLSVGFVIFSVVVIGAAGLGGAVQSGRISLDRFFNAPQTIGSGSLSFAPSAPGAHAAPKAPVLPPPPPSAPAPSVPAAPKSFPPKTFVVSSISIGNPSFAIINGVSYTKDKEVQSDTVKGWIVRQITENSVILQNGDTAETVPLNSPDLKPLDDTLQPLN
jgi:hypothetical protein